MVGSDSPAMGTSSPTLVQARLADGGGGGCIRRGGLKGGGGSSYGPCRRRAEIFFKLKSSWHRRRSKILAVSLKHWKGRRGGGVQGGVPPLILRRTAVLIHPWGRPFPSTGPGQTSPPHSTGLPPPRRLLGSAEAISRGARSMVGAIRPVPAVKTATSQGTGQQFTSKTPPAFSHT